MPPSSPGPSLRYRPDIDGLRAFAILPVVFYHFKVPGFSGGFVGVDIFFVISGYLITGLLTQPDRPLTLAAFYARRIRRLTPALALMLVGSTLAALMLLPPTQLMSYAESLGSVVLGLSNVYFWKSLASYFAVSGESQPLLHTWSLAVEEQFYVLFPPFLFIAARLGPRWRLIGVAAGCAASFALAAYLAPRAPSGSFYLAPTRAWELLAGCTLALAPRGWAAPGRWAGPAGLMGLALIAFAVASFGPESQVPGLAAAIPCLGALLLIGIGEAAPKNLVSRLLGARPLVAIGLISYALYLWHWPINVFLRRYVLLGPMDAWMTAAAIAAAFALASLSWLLIERPLRRGPLLASPARAFAFLALFAAVTIAFGIGILASRGWPGRFPGLQALSAPTDTRAVPVGLLGKNPGPLPPTSRWLYLKPEPTARRVMVWGDSYAGRTNPGFRVLEARTPFSVLLHVNSACPPVIGFNSLSNPSCRRHIQRALEQISNERVDTVVLVARWDTYTATGKLKFEQIAETVSSLRALGLDVVLVGQSPTFVFDYPAEFHYMRMRRGLRAEEGWAPNLVDPSVNRRLHDLAPEAFFDPTPLFCRARLCAYRQEGQFVVNDSGHLSTYGSTRLVAALLQTPELRKPRAVGR